MQSVGQPYVMERISCGMKSGPQAHLCFPTWTKKGEKRKKKNNIKNVENISLKIYSVHKMRHTAEKALRREKGGNHKGDEKPDITESR